MSSDDTVAAAVGRLLAGLGATRCFGVTGSANFVIGHALQQAGVPYVAAFHEGNAVTMADAHARMSEGLVIASLHSGPGLTNAVTAIAEAAKSRTPLLVLAGDIATGALRSNFQLEQAELVRAVGATFERLHTPHTALADAMRAAQTALRERRTVVLSMPLDVQQATLPAGATAPRPLPPAGPAQPAPEDVSRLAEALERAERPLLLAGRGALIAQAGPAVAELAEATGALVATTACAHGLFAQNPFSLGISGGFSSPAAVELIAQSDLIVTFGASLTNWTTRNGKLIGPQARIAQVDVETARIGYQRPVDIAVIGDAGVTARALLDALGGKAARAGWRGEETRAHIAAGGHHDAPFQDVSTAEHIDPRTLSIAMDALLPDDRIVVTDAGHSMGWPPLYLRVPDARSWCFTQSFQSVGLGLAGAIGSGLTQPDRLIVLGTGDGGFMMSLADLRTAVQLGQRLCILVYNDASYSAEVHYFRRLGYNTGIVEFPDTDLAAIARGHGAQGAIVRTADDLQAVRDWVAAGAKGVFLVDAKINPDLEADWHKDAFEIPH